MYQWFGFDFGLVTMLCAIILPALYLVSYGFSRFDAWRLGKEVPRHKVLINVFLALVIGFVFGGVAQHLYDKISTCLQLVDNLGSCIRLLPTF
ncbi:hypothetical protein [Enterobacter asburiae]|uniref:hypothetical protein n=1 Tax=Enterobacter asburiae TaxID=61645 RepID=UPI0021CECC70|nr:hypothetical protein [Enterobacter asburiae]MCU6243894.1 hypothetical protein [Enterobacter asburiae]